MARHAEDREDLLRDAKAMVPRVLLQVVLGAEPCELFVGFRGAALSFYFDSDPVYQFNSAGELRRAFVDGCIIKAEARQLQVWQAVRTANGVTMQSRVLTSQEEQAFGTALKERVMELCEALARSGFALVGEVPVDGNTVERLQTWLASWQGLRISASANV